MEATSKAADDAAESGITNSFMLRPYGAKGPHRWSNPSPRSWAIHRAKHPITCAVKWPTDGGPRPRTVEAEPCNDYRKDPPCVPSQSRTAKPASSD